METQERREKVEGASAMGCLHPVGSGSWGGGVPEPFFSTRQMSDVDSQPNSHPCMEEHP